MSSDETDNDLDTGETRFKVFIKEWRHPQVRELLKVLDTLYTISRKTARQGSLPRPRNASDVVDTTRTHVVGLPRNAYNPTWLDRIGAAMVDELRSTHDHDFACGPDIQQ